MPAASILKLAKVVDLRLKRDGATSPGVRALTRLFEALYFTSLKTEEGKPLQVRIVLVDPRNPDPDRPPVPRPERWRITKLDTQLPLTVPHLLKLSKAADPWSSCLAAYFKPDGEFFIWGLVDQTVHFNIMLVRESGERGGYAPPGLFQAVASGVADLSVYREFDFVARLQQDRLLNRQNDVFWSGPISKRLGKGIERHINHVWRRLKRPPDELFDWWPNTLADTWISTLCRILISIQRYRHGGAVLISRSRSDLDIKYGLAYTRLPEALSNLAVSSYHRYYAREEIHDKYFDNRRKNIPMSLYLDEAIADGYIEDFEAEITGCVRFISSLSCVDGLILATPDLAITGFGVEIRTRSEVGPLYLSSGPAARQKELRRVDPSHYGTRHRSMMRYCFSHPRSVGFVISQDGEIRTMTRVKDKLVMWENLKVLSFFAPPRSKIKEEAKGKIAT